MTQNLISEPSKEELEAQNSLLSLRRILDRSLTPKEIDGLKKHPRKEIRESNLRCNAECYSSEDLNLALYDIRYCVDQKIVFESSAYTPSKEDVDFFFRRAFFRLNDLSDEKFFTYNDSSHHPIDWITLEFLKLKTVFIEKSDYESIIGLIHEWNGLKSLQKHEWRKLTFAFGREDGHVVYENNFMIELHRIMIQRLPEFQRHWLQAEHSNDISFKKNNRQAL
jgi:hypothetical protein